MGDRRNLLGTSAVLVGLGTALISGTAVANADTGGSDGRQGDGPSASTSAADSTAPAPRSRRAGTRAAATTNPAPAASAADDAPVVRGNRPRGKAAQADVVVPQQSQAKNAAPAPAATESATAAVPVPETAPAVAQAPQAVAQAPQDVVTPAPAAPAPVALSAPVAPAASGVTARSRLIPSVAASAPAPVTAYAAAAAPTPAPAAAQILDALASLGLLPSGAPIAATPALAAWTGQLSDAEPTAVVGASPAAAGPPDPKLPGLPTNGVTGVQVGHSRLVLPGAFIGDTVPADWYFPTQADGSVEPQGLIWLQHGFGASNTFYSALATELAQKTNSVVVAPTLSSSPLTFSGGWLNGETTQQAAAEALLDPNRTALVDSALAAGYTGDVEALKGDFVLAGHSAGGGFSSAVGADYVNEGSDVQDANLRGVVMYDGVSNGTFDDTFTTQIQALATADKPVYQIAAPAQVWNMFAATSNQLLAARPDTFDGVVLVGGSHIDSMLGVNPFLDTVLQLVAGKSPAGNTAATYTLSTGWINDFYTPGATPQAPEYGFYPAANQQIIFGNAAGVGLPSVTLNQTTPIGGALESLSDCIFKLFGIPVTPKVNTGSNGVTALVTPPETNGVTGVQTGSSVLTIPSGNGYNAPADWYFPTQADGSVKANGVIWLQHGFLGFSGWYSDLATRLAQETNSIVVSPSIFWFDPAYTGEAAAEMFVGARPALNISANAAGYQGELPQKFILTGHSAGGRFAVTAGGDTVDNGAFKDLLGVVMFDGVDGADQFAASLAQLDSKGIPVYQIAAPPQSWNAWGGTTEQLALLHPGEFIGTMIDQGSHTDSIGGDSFFGWLGTIGSDIFVKPSPPGGKEAVGTFATGWINDIYGGFGPTDPGYGIYGNPNDGTYQPNRPIVMGEAGATTLPAPPPVDVEKYSGLWYEQGSVKQFFAIGLVNTTATYTPQPDGTIKVENAGNYFGPNGPQSTITGSAVPVNSPTNTRLDVGFFFGQPKPKEPGNYWIIDYDPSYKWAIVSDSTFSSGYILTRDQFISADEYDALVARAKQLGVTGRITPTQQFPASSSAAVSGPAAVPATVLI
jgi:lipocalin